ncbi:hypothetical protein EVG20_g5932 [Dentipellis fragilis]|uniref:Uncharacterized protein n=1 Tax=Dentipellis fragilis TaxID=205917 RepID=A0A4Y9YRR4_9AGAM|nr:hypothetical protein EVG20_g5932 [Dentipellis fragilis]
MISKIFAVLPIVFVAACSLAAPPVDRILSPLSSKAPPYVTSAANEAESYASKATSDVDSIVSSAPFSQEIQHAMNRAKDILRRPNGVGDQSVISTVTVVNGSAFTDVSADGTTITLAPPGEGVPTTFEGSVYTVVGAAPTRTGDTAGNSAPIASAVSNAAASMRRYSNVLAFCGGF